jgi:alkylation response protein AidB-like acyl-CoA dehydrogenase
MPVGSPVGVQALLARAEGLADLIGEEAARSEADATLSPVVVEAFHETGLFGLMVPKELGGEEADLATVLAVYEEVSRADGSAGWTLLANATTSSFAGAYLGPIAVAEMFRGDRIPVAAGQFSPRGTAVRAVDGAADDFVVSGRYSFGSGSAHSPWIGGGAFELLDGEFVAAPSGLPMIRAYFVPRDRVEFLDNWDVMGLAGTGSYDYEVPEQTIHEDFTFDLINAEPRRGGPVYRLGVLGLTAAGHAAFALGVGRRGIEELTRIVQTKHRLGADPLRDQQVFRHDYAMHDAALLAARAFVYESFVDVQDVLDDGDDLTALQRQRLRQATTYATRVATDAVRFAYTAAGTDALRPGPLQRCFRDLHASTQHLMVDNNTLTDTTRVLLGLDG